MPCSPPGPAAAGLSELSCIHSARNTRGSMLYFAALVAIRSSMLPAAGPLPGPVTRPCSIVSPLLHGIDQTVVAHTAFLSAHPCRLTGRGTGRRATDRDTARLHRRRLRGCATARTGTGTAARGPGTARHGRLHL